MGLLEGDLEVAMVEAIEGGMCISDALEHVGISKATWQRHLEVCVRCGALEPRHGQALEYPIVRRILELGDEGLTSVEISERLGIHMNTAQKYLRLARREDRYANLRQT